MAAYCRVYDSRHLRAVCQEMLSAPKPYAQQSSRPTGYLTVIVAVVQEAWLLPALGSLVMVEVIEKTRPQPAFWCLVLR